MPGSNPPYDDQSEYVPPPPRWSWLVLIAVVLILLAAFMVYLLLFPHGNINGPRPITSCRSV